MITGLWFLATLVIIGLVVHWAIVNDRSGNDGPTTGLFAMKDPRPPERPTASGSAPPAVRSRSRRG